jgi:hypothetical protein
VARLLAEAEADAEFYCDALMVVGAFAGMMPFTIAHHCDAIVPLVLKVRYRCLVEA